MARRSAIAKVTAKGQVTVPVDFRRALGIEIGDDLRFDLDSEGARIQVLKRRRLSDLYAALPADRPFPGKVAVRKTVGEARGAARG